jgi:hypothetical protein
MPSWKDLSRFCDADGWELYKNTGDYYYRKVMQNGEVKRTKCSKGTGEIRHHLWREILTKQLQVTMEYFNDKI